MKNIKNWQLEFTHSDKYDMWHSYDMCHDFIGVCGNTPINLDNSAECFIPMTLEEIDRMIAQEPEKITRSFQAHYYIHREILYAFRDTLRQHLVT
jgi:hypothetical protein